MARPRTIGLSYFPMDVDFFSDIKMRKLIKYQGGKAVAVYALLLCNIYKSGYYMRWDEELPFIISEQTGYDEAYVREAVKCCMVVGLFSLSMYEKEGVITSRGIQERYVEACAASRRKSLILEYSLLDDGGVSSAKTGVSSEETRVSSEETGGLLRKNAIKERKVNKRKEKESIKEKDRGAAFPDTPAFAPTNPKAERTPPPAPSPQVKRAVFTPPTLEEVKAYVAEKGYRVNAERWWNFYDARGWMMGKNKMQRWRSAVATWDNLQNDSHDNSRHEDRRRAASFGATCEQDYETTF